MGLLAALDLIIPPACAGCGLPGPPACPACLATLQDIPPPWCGGCGGPVAVPVDRCPECRGPVERARQAVRYAGAVPALVAALKDGRRRPLAEVLAAETAERVAPPPVGVALVPVPLGPRRLRERGFNQSLLLARALGRRWRRPVADALVRVSERGDQRGAAASARARQVAAAFAPAPGRRAPAHAWLVDDVRTTGATLAACARALRVGGSRSVGAVCVARVEPGGDRGRPFGASPARR